MKEFILSIISLVVGFLGGYYSHVLKQNRFNSREADLVAFDELVKNYPLDSCYLAIKPSERLSVKEKVRYSEIEKLIDYTDDNQIKSDFYFHNKKVNSCYNDLRTLLANFCKLVLDNMEQSSNSLNIYYLKHRSKLGTEEYSQYETLANEIDSLGEQVVQKYLKFKKVSKIKLKI